MRQLTAGQQRALQALSDEAGARRWRTAERLLGKQLQLLDLERSPVPDAATLEAIRNEIADLMLALIRLSTEYRERLIHLLTRQQRSALRDATCPF